MNRAEFLKKLHTEKSVIIQQYRPLYPAVYSVVTNQTRTDNIAMVLYQDGRRLALQGDKYGTDFRTAEQPRLNHTVGNILSAMEAARQENLWHGLSLDTCQRIFPTKGSKLPYFSLNKSDYGVFAYSPLSTDKYAFIIPDSFGLFKEGANHRYLGAYGNDLKSMLNDNYFHLDDTLIASKLCSYEPAAVWEYEENYVLKKLDQMTRETNARPYIFSQAVGKPIVSLPVEVKEYLSPAEAELAEKLVVLQESAGEIEEHVETETPALQALENTPVENGLKMTL